MGLVNPQTLTSYLSHRWKNWRIAPSGCVSVPTPHLQMTNLNPYELSVGERNAIL